MHGALNKTKGSRKQNKRYNETNWKLVLNKTKGRNKMKGIMSQKKRKIIQYKIKDIIKEENDTLSQIKCRMNKRKGSIKQKGR